MSASPSAVAEINALLRAADSARRGGRPEEAQRLFLQVVEREPAHAEALNALGMAILGTDDAAAASYFERAAAADPSASALSMNAATAYRNLGDPSAERRVLDRVLVQDQRHLMANVRMAELLDRIGQSDQAAFRWGGVAAILRDVPVGNAALEQLRDRAEQALAARSAILSKDLDRGLETMRAEALGTAGVRATRRFDACIDAMLGRRRIYVNEPHGLHFPFLPADEFFDRSHFPWFERLEAATDMVREELTSLLAERRSEFAPYVAMLPGTPPNIWSPLDRRDDWSALYLWRYGERNDAVCALCPRTAALLESIPRADLPGRAPTAFFSLLKPGAHLPPHTGVSNVRGIVHLPLIVPPNCGFRVGGERRTWTVGEAFAFDDTIEHEAWNEGTSDRIVLIFDVWNPYLTVPEQRLIRRAFDVLGPYLNAVTEIVD